MNTGARRKSCDDALLEPDRLGHAVRAGQREHRRREQARPKQPDGEQVFRQRPGDGLQRRAASDALFTGDAALRTASRPSPP